MILRNYQSLAVFVTSICIVCVISCRNKEKMGPVIFVTPNALQLSAVPSQIIEFSVRSQAGDNQLSRVIITSKPSGGNTTTVKDTSIIGQESEFFFVVTIPSGLDEIKYNFTLYDTEGLSSATTRTLTIEQPTNVLLLETAGFELYSKHNFGSNNGFRISTLSYFQLDTDPDSSLIDLTEMDELDDDMISHNLTSFSGYRFVRNNAFNYAQATKESAEASYTSSTSQQLITNVQVNDILITEYDTTAHSYAVIKITGVFDDTGVSLDRYIFNVKK